MTQALHMVELRRGGVPELQTIADIMRAAFDPRFGEAWSAGQCSGILAMPGVWLTMAFAEREAAGFTLARVILDEAELLLLATLPGLRGQGIGAALLDAMVRDAAARDAAKVHLEVRQGNPAIRLYERSGFAKIGERLRYYRGANGEDFDALTYARILR